MRLKPNELAGGGGGGGGFVSMVGGGGAAAAAQAEAIVLDLLDSVKDTAGNFFVAVAGAGQGRPEATKRLLNMSLDGGVGEGSTSA